LSETLRRNCSNTTGKRHGTRIQPPLPKIMTQARIAQPRTNEATACATAILLLSALAAALAIHRETLRWTTAPKFERYNGPLLWRTPTAPTARESQYISPIGVHFVRVPAPPRPPGVEPCPNEDTDASCHFLFVSTKKITQAQWFAITGTNPSLLIAPEEPVNTVNFMETRAFYLANRPLDGGLYRLPSPAEWDWLLRAGAIETETLAFPWCALDCSTQGANIAPPRKNAGHPWGILDLCDSMSEWTAVDEDPTALQLALSTQSATHSGYLLRVATDNACTLDRSARSDFYDKSSTIGFRLVLEPRQ
jgi:hypothetical protein